MLKSFNDFTLEVFDETYLLHLVSDSQRFSFSQELTPTLKLSLTLKLRLGLDPWSDPKLTLTLTLRLVLGLGLGLTPGKTISNKSLKRNAKDEYLQRLLG